MTPRWKRNRRGVLIGLFIAALSFGVFISSSAQVQSTSRGPVVRLKENDGRENEFYLYKESWALIVGVSEYEHWTDLPGVDKDVDRVSNILQKHGFKIQHLKNPTRQDFKTTIDDFINKRGLDFENRLIIYFAGHGVTLKGPDNREEGYLVMRDTPLSEPDETNFIRKAAPIGWMERHAKDIKSKHALFVFDSCFSGKLFEEMRRRGNPLPGDIIKPVRQFITAGTANQTVPDKSIFCDYFIRALDGAADSNNDGYVMGWELAEYLKRRVKEDSGRSQTPMAGKLPDPKLNQGDFVFNLPGKASKVLEVAPSRDDVGAPAAREELREKPKAAMVIFEEHFNNNNRRWPEVSNKDVEFAVADNSYVIDSRVAGQWFSSIPVALNQEEDFKIECSVEKIEGVDNYAYGLIWGMKDLKNFYYFLIMGEGFFGVGRVQEGINTDIIPRSIPNSINRFNSANKLTIEKKSSQIQFFINDQLAGKAQFEPFYGNGIGFNVYNKQKISFTGLVISTNSK